MNILVKRDVSTARSLTSQVSINQVFLCFGLEPPWDPTGTKKPRAVGEGTFDVEIRWSPKHGRLLPWVLSVPGFQDIEMHPGNFEYEHQDAHGVWRPPDSEGCLCVGIGRGIDSVLNSVQAFEDLFRIIQDAEAMGEKITVTYQNCWGPTA